MGNRYVIRSATVSFALMALAACTTTAPVENDFPVPVMNSMPLTVGVQYGEEFSTFEFREEIPGQQHWIVQMGPANVGLFDNVFGAMFSETVQIPNDGNIEQGDLGVPRRRLDAIIRPEIETYEFAIPSDWGSNTFTVWITYRMKMYRPDGSLIASWPVRSYGESLHQWFNSDDSLSEATTMAMRDAGAYLTLYFKDEPKIREWLREEADMQALERRRGGRLGRSKQY
jgi:hypothetical protein